MESVSGDLSYGGPLDPTGTYDFRAHSGNISLQLPGDVGALLSVDTFSGDIETDFPLTISPNNHDDMARPGITSRRRSATAARM